MMGLRIMRHHIWWQGRNFIAWRQGNIDPYVRLSYGAAHKHFIATKDRLPDVLLVDSPRDLLDQHLKHNVDYTPWRRALQYPWNMVVDMQLLEGKLEVVQDSGWISGFDTDRHTHTHIHTLHRLRGTEVHSKFGAPTKPAHLGLPKPPTLTFFCEGTVFGEGNDGARVDEEHGLTSELIGEIRLSQAEEGQADSVIFRNSWEELMEPAKRVKGWSMPKTSKGLSQAAIGGKGGSIIVR